MIELEPEALPAFLAQKDIGGLNVTIPYKRDVMPLCDVIDKDAQAIGSVNTLVRRPDGKLYAWNTDAAGFRYMTRRISLSFEGKKVVILGSGGASLTVQAVARQMGAREIVVISRTGENNYNNLSCHADADILVNATPVGMYPNNGNAPVDLTLFSSLHGVLDLIYNPRRTALLLQAEALHISCSDGLPMLVAQAVAAEEHFFHKTFPDSEIERVLNKMRLEMTNIILIGMPGSGKSTVGKALGRLTGREVIDLDEQIVQRAGRTIPKIFSESGEEGFRTLEREETAAAGKLTGKIIITGGGVVKDIRNYAPLRQNGRIYHLTRDIALLPSKGRPLSQTTDLKIMWVEREPLYTHFRDVIIENNTSIDETAQKIWTEFNNNFQ